MKRSTYRLLICYLSVLIALVPGTGYGQLRDSMPNAVEDLEFTPMAHNHELTFAGDSLGNTWVRGTIPSALLGIPLVFRIPSVRQLHYELYAEVGGRWTRLQRNTSREARHFKSRYPQYDLNTAGPVYYLLFEGPLPSTLQVTLDERDQFADNEAMELLGIGLYYGLALMSVIFNIVFYFIFRDKRFFSYCILLFSTFLIFFYEDGMFYYLSDGRWTMEYFSVWNSSITAMMSLVFTYYFLGLKEDVTRRWFITFLVAVGILFSGALTYTLTGSAVVQQVVKVLCFLFAITGLYLAVRRFRTDIYARFLAISFSLVVLVGVFYVLYSRFDSSTFSHFNISTFRLVSAIEIICISFAIIVKMRSLQRENEQFRSELDKYLKALEVKELSKEQLAEELKQQYDLTDREVDVLRCLWDGLTNKEIADRLYITVSTTKYHMGNLYVKLDVKNRNQVQVLYQSIPDQSSPTTRSNR